ncbi:MAG: DUF4173 domain-containing protein [Lachnospiraceae bacterium]|nr:DUF4173 domain-containing protein [Lachnospiraceae bacterium]
MSDMTKPMAPPMLDAQVRGEQLIRAEAMERTSIFGKMIVPTLIYAVVFAFCVYDNWYGILMGGFAIATIVYMKHMMKVFGVEQKRGSLFYMVALVLLGFSNGLTGDDVIIFFNDLFIIGLVVVFLLHNYMDDVKWGPVAYLGAIFQSIFGAIPCIGDLGKDAACYSRSEDNASKKSLFSVLIGIGIAIPLMLIIVGLLCSADVVFATILHDTLHIDFYTCFGVLLTFLFGFVAAYCGMRFMGKGNVKFDATEGKRFGAVVAVTVLSMITVVYVFFSVIQILSLFLGKMTLPDGYTYAKYAREGFFQLLFVCLLNVAIVLFTMAKFEQDLRVKWLLTAISICTYIMLASSAMRMMMYIQVYYLTRLRFMVLWGLATIAVVLIGVMIATFRKAFPLFKYLIVSVGIAYLVLSYSHMDYFITKYNLEAGAARAVDGDMEFTYFDQEYLNGLSTDAAMAFVNSTTTLKSAETHYLENKSYYGNENFESWRQFNLSHALLRYYFGDEMKALVIQD